MKKVLENIKANKLRSTLIGISAFLFGFISVSVFNNIGDTYAIATGCPSGWTPISLTSDMCCPDTWGYSKDTKKCGFSEVVGDNENAQKEFKSKCGEYNGVVSIHQSDTYICQVSPLQAQDKNISVTFHLNRPFKYFGEPQDRISFASYGDTNHTEATLRSSYSCIKGSEKCENIDIPTISAEHHEFNGWSTTSDCENIYITQNGGIINIDKDLNLYACYTEVPGCFIHNTGNDSAADPTAYVYHRYGTYSALLSTNMWDRAEQYDDDPIACIANNASKAPNCYVCNGKLSWQQYADGCTELHIRNSENLCTPTYVDTYNDYYTGPGAGGSETANTRKFYTIQYDLNGGTFVDGSTSRTRIVNDNSPLGTFETNPVKKGYQFVEWQSGGKSVDFSQKPTSDMTLVAVYEAFEDYDDYKCEGDDKFDPVTMRCYSTLKNNSSNNQYTYTTYSYDAGETYCYAYNGGDSVGGVYPHINASISSEGKQDAKYSGFEGQDDWVSSDTCKLGRECTDSSDTNYPACSYTFSAIVYHSYQPNHTYSNGELIEEPSDGIGSGNNDEGNYEGGKPSDDDVNTSPETGDSLIIIVCIIGLSALAYTAYYFIKRNKRKLEV